MSAPFYPEVNPNPDFPAIEEKILAFWARERIFERSVEARPSQKDGHSNEFIFYDGPPFANGLPHYGHLLTGYVKDLFARYQTMRGKRVERRFGWDCHGLPAEMGAEKELGISGRQAIMQYGIGKFNDHCRQSVMKYTQEWQDYVTRQARWVDFGNDYKTMNVTFMESVLWAFKQLYDKGLVYEAYRVMPYSWAAETPLSNFETRLDNSTREREDKAITVAFELNTPPHGAPAADKYYVLAWTTTPWTLPSNLALAVNKEVEYAAPIVNHLSFEGKSERVCYILAQSAIQHYSKELLSQVASLETEHCILRPLTENDKKNYLALIADTEVMRTLSIGPLQGENAEKDFASVLEHQKKHGFGIWGVFLKDSGKFIGRAGLRLFALDPDAPPQLVLHYILDKAHWNQGYASEAAKTWTDFGFTVLGANKIVSGALPHNAPSLRILEKLGYKYVKTVKVLGDDTHYVELSASDYFAKSKLFGKDLINLSYHPLFPYFANHKHAFRILDGSDFVTDTDGTGIVHLAPGFGEDDQRVCEANGIELVCPVDHAGRYTDEIFDIEDSGFRIQDSGIKESSPESRILNPGSLSLKGLNVIAEPGGSKFGLANDRIIDYLKKSGQLIKQETIKHNYPHCWRTDQPLIYRAISSWYVEVTKFRDRMVELNQQINWIPGHIKDGLFGKWLEGARDWSISRNRFWGTPIPVWRSASGKIKVFGSIKEIEQAWKDSGFRIQDSEKNASSPESRIPNPESLKLTDLHRPYIDDIVITEGGEEYLRVEDVFDCWFESGSMPYGQVHYPFENKDWFEHHFPADFIVEYQAQTRGWFYTLMVLGTALFDKPPFKNCICHGVVLDDKGQKLSKRLNNYADPKELFDKFGADALRWFMMASPVMRGDELHIDKEGKFIRDVVRLAIKPIWNAYNFFCLYANADGVKAELIPSPAQRGRVREGDAPHNQASPSLHHPLPNPPPHAGEGEVNVMDRYILAKCKQAVEATQKAFDHYETPAATEAVSQFFEALNNWYIRRNKERFWKSEHDADKQAAYDTLYTVLTTMCRAAAPLLPLTCEEIYKGLTLPPLPPGEGRSEGGATNPKPKTSPELLDRMRGLRKNATDAETHLWYKLRDRQMAGAKFKRQQSIGPYIVDFCCHEAKLIVELDGGQHAEQQKAYDEKRDAFLKTQGYTVMRFWNNDALQNTGGVLQAIHDHLSITLVATPSPGATRHPLPEGEEIISVHLTDWPNVSAFATDKEIIQQMDWIRDVCNTALAIRNTQKIRVRQPLSTLTIYGRGGDHLGIKLTILSDGRLNAPALKTVGGDIHMECGYGDIIQDELNVQHVQWKSDISEVADYKLSLNNPVLGKRLPEKMKQIIPASKKGEWKQLPGGGIEICGETLLPGEFTLQLEPKPEYKDRAQALSTNDALVILDTTITPELEAEGIARDVVRMIQQARKDANLNVSDRITLHIAAPEAILQAIATHKEYILEQTLSVALADKKPENPTFSAENMLDEQKIVISFSVV